MGAVNGAEARILGGLFGVSFTPTPWAQGSSSPLPASPNDSQLAPCTHLRKSKSMVENWFWMRAQSAQRK